jgi:ribosome-associated protein
MPRQTPAGVESALVQDVQAALEDLKAQDVKVIHVGHLTSLMDVMIVASGRSDRHVRAIADAVVEHCKELGVRPLGVEGHLAGEWVLVDLTDVVVHVMLPRVREFYDIENLWEMPAPRERQDEGQP